MQTPMADAAPQTAPITPPAARTMGGRRVVLVLLILLPAIIVPLLLTGSSKEDQVCLRTLTGRHTKVWRVGSWNLSEPKWRVEDTWTIEPGEDRLLPPFDRLPNANPSAFWAAAGVPSKPNQWAAYDRVLPFAFTLGVENTKALRDWRRDIVDARRALVAVLDPSDPADAALLRAADAALAVGFDEVEHMRPNKLRRRGQTKGEAAGERIVEAALAAQDLPEPKREAAFRASLAAILASLPKEG